ncbi:MAG: hypothetical protein OEM46_11210 [Ignavibacteria bacterium]|nr:hypothetical protein [Ignavibacteria bacterium]
MKKLLILSLFSFLLFFGCNQDSEILTPVEEISDQEYKLISLPTPTGGLSIETIYTFSEEISGEQGGIFYNRFSYQGGPFGTVTVNSRLLFPENSFSGYADITKTYNTDYATMEYGPSMSFNVPVLCGLRFYGLDLSGVDPETVRFVYIANDGTIEDVAYESLSINVASGYLYVKNAQLNHFSRYGFVN